LVLFNPTRPSYEESAYWRYESALKALEGHHGAVLGANGGLYAIRKAFFRPLHASTVVDDFVLPMRLLLQGRRVAFEPSALAFEETTEDYSREFARRARIAAGNFQSLKWLWPLLSPRRGFVAYAFWSHKVLRWVAPFLLLAAFWANAFLWERGGGLYRFTFLAQGAFYALALLGRVGWLPRALQRAASMANYFVSMNLALATGFWRFLRNSQSAAWERTSRPG
jgi:cellulose synthase/poly-beta-1,6-N-acetylglucosamine synthase-like glycosyltransferase